MPDLISHYFSSIFMRNHCKAFLLSLIASVALIPPSVLGQSYITNGIGAYTEFNENSLLIKLEMEAPVTDTVEVMAVDTSKKLSFRIMQNRSPRAWSKIWIQNLSINNSADTLTTQTNDLIAMTQALKGTLRTGDLVQFERIASDLTIMSINGHEIADFETSGFFEFLLTAFIGSIPPSSELKNKLLAGERGNGDDAILFDSLGFTEERAAQIADWSIATDAVASNEDLPSEEPDNPSAESEEELADPDVVTAETGEEQIASVATELNPELNPELNSELDPEVNSELDPEVNSEVNSEPESTPVVAQTTVEEDEAPIMITAESLLAAQNYQRSVLQQVYRSLEYPGIAQRRNQEGALRLTMAIDANGSVSSIEVIENARHRVLDEAAIAAIENASPFEPLPQGTAEIPMILEIPIAFRLQ